MHSLIFFYVFINFLFLGFYFFFFCCFLNIFNYQIKWNYIIVCKFKNLINREDSIRSYHLRNYNTLRNINKRFKITNSKYTEYKNLHEQNHNLQQKSNTKNIASHHIKFISNTINNFHTITNQNSQKSLFPKTISNTNFLPHENLFTNSENSYSSTYNSSSRTKLISENTIKNHPLLTNTNNHNINNNNHFYPKSMLKK